LDFVSIPHHSLVAGIGEKPTNWMILLMAMKGQPDKMAAIWQWELYFQNWA